MANDQLLDAEGLSNSLSNFSFNSYENMPSITLNHTEYNNNNYNEAGNNTVVYTTEAILPITITRISSDLLNSGIDDKLESNIQTEENKSLKSVENAERVLEMYIQLLAVSNVSKIEKIKVLKSILASIERAWTLPVKGRHLAYRLCDVLRQTGGINCILENLSHPCSDIDNGKSLTFEKLPQLIQPLKESKSHKIIDDSCSSKKTNESVIFYSDRDLLLESASVLAQTMTVPNREYVANLHNGLKTIVTTADNFRDDTEVTRAALGILESLFKHTEVTCKRLIECGGLDSILYACRHFDTSVLRPCAVALANLALYGDEECHQFMISRNAPEWLFPLAFSEDDAVKYYAFIAIAVLRVNASLEVAVTRSGTLHLIEPFLRHRNPVQFGVSDRAHMHGHSAEWLVRMRPLFYSDQIEVQSLAAFHFAMEASIKKRQHNLEVFEEIDVIEPLKRLSESNCSNNCSSLASRFATEALEILGIVAPNSLNPKVALWLVDDIYHWMKQNKLSEEIIRKFQEDSQMDVDLFLQLNDEDLKNDFNLIRRNDRKKFLRQLSKLKEMANYESCDQVSMEIREFLNDVGSSYKQYTYQMCKAGMDVSTLKLLTDDHLKDDCDITNGIHRAKILEAAKLYVSSMGAQKNKEEHNMVVEKFIDVFISYRRSNGSQLASLLKVHLQVRGYSVFLDIEKLPVGKFDENLIRSIKSSKNFLLVLTPNALDRCIGDDDCHDWIHREIVAALSGNCNIIPIIDDFQYPSCHLLPEDIKNIGYFNGIRWIHDYQDACIEKLEQFINGSMINNVQKKTPDQFHYPLSKNSGTGFMTPTFGELKPLNDSNQIQAEPITNKLKLSSNNYNCDKVVPDEKNKDGKIDNTTTNPSNHLSCDNNNFIRNDEGEKVGANNDNDLK